MQGRRARQRCAASVQQNAAPKVGKTGKNGKAKALEFMNHQTAAEVEIEDAPESQDKVAFTEDDIALLEEQENVIASNIGAFLLLGEALNVIQSRNLQRITDPELTFEEYCSSKWGIGDKYGYKLISAYQCVRHLQQKLGPNGVTVYPSNEAQVRPLTKLEPDEQVKAWADVLKQSNGGNITAAMVDEVANGSAAKKDAKSEATPTTKNAATTPEHRKLQSIAKLIEKVKQIDRAKLNLEKLLDTINRIEKLLKSDLS